ncbi:MAG: hypothetical protein ACYTET_00770, partial [Planctomycetota bacterium]
NSFLLGDDSDQLVPGHPHIWEEGETTYLGYDWRNAKEGHSGPGLDPFFDIFGIRKLYWVNDWPTIWVPITLTFNAYDYPESIDQALGIKMRNSGESSTYIAFDHLSLEYSLLPSPDIDGNDKVNLVNLAFFGFQWLFSDCQDFNGADFNGDGNVNSVDLGIFVDE